jgi:hypothetical protein
MTYSKCESNHGQVVRNSLLESALYSTLLDFDVIAIARPVAPTMHSGIIMVKTISLDILALLQTPRCSFDVCSEARGRPPQDGLKL